MKKWIWVLVIIVLLVVFACKKEENDSPGQQAEAENIAPVAQEIDGKITACLVNFERGEVGAGVLQLFDAVALARPVDSFPEGFVEKLESAKQKFLAGSYQEGVSETAQARQLFETAVEIDPPSESDQIPAAGEMNEGSRIAPIASMIKDKIESARMMFKEGKADRGVVMLLEAIELLAPLSSVQE